MTTSDEVVETPTELFNDALIEFTACVGNALEDLCSYGLTLGEAYVPFDPDEDEECDAEEAVCSQAWVRVTDVSPLAGGTEGFGGESCSASLRMGLEVGVLRCIDIPEGGEAPSASDVMIAALQSLADMRAIFCAAMSCEVWDAIDIGTWTPSGPLGGQYGGIWTFSVDI